MVSKADLKRIRKNACRKTVWTGREMQEYIQQQTGVKYNLIHVRYIGAELGLFPEGSGGKTRKQGP